MYKKVHKYAHKGGNMKMFKEMYLHLFNAISDAVDELVKQNYGNATKILKEAQWKCEDMYIYTIIA